MNDRAEFLGPQVVAETYRYRNGKTGTVYRCPYPTQGPTVLNGESGGRVLAYMYAHFVFHWPEWSAQLSVSHGTLAEWTFLWRIEIAVEWKERPLVEYAQAWVRGHLGKFGMSEA